MQEIESKYSDEVVLHSSDIQRLTSVKKELLETQQQIAKLQAERDDALEVLKLKSSSWEEKERKLITEVKELNQRLIDLDQQNQVLHENLQELGNQVAVLQCRVRFKTKYLFCFFLILNILHLFTLFINIQRKSLFLCCINIRLPIRIRNQWKIVEH